MIALGLSSLFGMGWAIGLLASSDLPDAVRYPAEWIFTLATAFLGVYLFVLYVLRSQEARKFWKSLLLCQHKRKGVVSFSSSHTQTRNRFRTLSSTFASLRGTLKNRRDTESVTEGRSTTTIRSGSQAIHLQPINLQLVEKLKPEEWCYSEAFSPESSTIPSEGGKKVTLEKTGDMSSGQYAKTDNAVLSMEEELVDEIDLGDWCYSKVHPSYQFHADNLLPVSDAVPSQSNPSLSSTQEECYVVENKQTEGSDITPQ